jgi:hypothetical protein
VARALLAAWTTIPPAEQSAALARWRALQPRLAARGCHYWVFASTSRPGRYLEFTEAADADTIRQARRAAGLPDADDDYLTEVELS